MKSKLYILITLLTFLSQCEYCPAQSKVKIWLFDTLWNNPKVVEWAEKNVDGFLLSNSAKAFANSHREMLKNCMLPVDEWAPLWEWEYPEIIYHYADECYTTMTEVQRKYVLDFQKVNPDKLILGEIPPCNFRKLDDGITRFVFTSYQKYLFTIFGVNIYCPFANQIESVKGLIEMFPNRAPFIWIAIDQVNDFPELIKFAHDNNLICWLYAGNEGTTVEQVITNGDKFIAELKRQNQFYAMPKMSYLPYMTPTKEMQSILFNYYHTASK